MDLSEFLVARIREDEADAMVGWRWKALPSGEYDRLQSRVLAECDAKRRIVGSYAGSKNAASGLAENADPVAHLKAMIANEIAESHYRDMQALALPYADHDEYCAEWKP